MTTDTTRTYIDDFVASDESRAAYVEGSLIADVHAILGMALESMDLSQSELAKRLGVSRARVNQLMSGDANITIMTMARLAAGLGYTWQLGLDDIMTGESMYSLRTPRAGGGCWRVIDCSAEDSSLDSGSGMALPLTA